MRNVTKAQQRRWRIATWILLAVLFLVLGERWWQGTWARINVDSAVRYVPDIANRMTTHWHEHGEWPPPGETMNRGLHYVATSGLDETTGARTDHYLGVPDRVDFQLSADGTMYVFRRDGDLPSDSEGIDNE